MIVFANEKEGDMESKYTGYKLRVAEIAVTSSCNLKCKHCYQGDDKLKAFTIPFNTLKQILEDITKLGGRTIVLTGGEFFLYPKWKEVLEYAFRLGLNISIVTNGTLVDASIVSFLSKFRDKIRIAVSLDGFRDDHEFVRGKGTFDKVVSAIKLLTNAKIDVIVQTILTKNNIEYLDRFVEFIAELGVVRVTFINIGFAGYAVRYIDELTEKSKRFKEIVRQLYAAITQGDRIRSLSNIGYRCNIFPRSVSINYDCTVYPCTFARSIKVFPLGNVYNKRLMDIYLEALQKDFPFNRYVNIFQLEKCRSCSYFKECAGGCRIRAFKFFGDFFAPDPFACYIYRKEYEDLDINRLMWGER